MTYAMKIGTHALGHRPKRKKKLQYKTHRYLQGRARKVEQSLNRINWEKLK